MIAVTVVALWIAADFVSAAASQAQGGGASSGAGSISSQPCTSSPAQYSGFPVSFDFQGADLRAVLRTFADLSGLNIVIDASVQGTVDVALRDIPWDQALDVILRAARMGCEVDGTIVRIAPAAILESERAQRQKAEAANKLSGELDTATRTLSYARAAQVLPLVRDTLLSERGSIQVDARTNTVVVTDVSERIERVMELLATLDRPEPQVEIEARVVQTTRDFIRRIGVQWGASGRAGSELGNTLPFVFPSQASVGGRAGDVQGPESAPTAVNLGVPGATSALGLAFGAINGAVDLDVALSALEQAGQGRILSTPRVTTQNNVEAQIAQGQQIPIQAVANNTVTVTFRDATLTLLVTPQITAANTVLMRITVENARADFSREVNGIPPIETQRALTQVLVRDGETTVIGGIYLRREESQQARTPALHRLPFLGWLFQRRSLLDDASELVIFITPRVIRLEGTKP